MRAPLYALVTALCWLLYAPLALAASPEYAIGDPPLAAGPNDRWGAEIASDGTDFFAVWVDRRAPIESSIVATRVTRTGQVLDPTGITIARGIDYDSLLGTPHVVWSGSSYVVTFETGTQTWAARYSRDGRLEAGPRAIASNSFGDSSLATNGSSFLLGYRSPSGGIRAVLFGDDLAPLVDARLVEGSQYRAEVSVAAVGSRFVVAWGASTHAPPYPLPNIEAVRVSRFGEVLDATPRILGNGIIPHLASDGTDLVVVSMLRGAWFARRVSADLATVSGPQQLPGNEQIYPGALVWRGDHYVAIGRFGTFGQMAAVAVRISRDGVPDASLAILTQVQLYSYSPIVTGTVNAGGEMLVAWPEGFVNEHQHSRIVGRIYGEVSAEAGGPKLLLSGSAPRHSAPAVAFGHTGYLVTWAEQSGIYATRVSLDGRSLDGRGILLSEGPVFAAPEVVYDAGRYVIAWADHQQGVQLRFLSPASGTVERSTLPASVWTGIIGLAASPAGTFVAWNTSNRIQLALIPRGATAPVLPTLAVSPANELAQDPALAWSGSQLLVVWSKAIVPPLIDPGIPQPFRTQAARVTSTLLLLDPVPLLLGESVNDYDVAPQVASDGADWLVTWRTREGKDILARRVLRDGTLEGNGPTRVAAGVAAKVVWDGTRYAIAWKDETFAPALRLAYVARNGAIVPENEVLVAQTESPQLLFGLTPALGRVAAAYARVSLAPEHGGVERTFLRVVDPAPPGGRKRRAVR